MVTVSTKRNRVYTRAFDHDEAIRLHAEGWSANALARKFGVSVQAVLRVCNPKVREQMQSAATRWSAENKRASCLGGCGTLVWLTHKDRTDRTGYCRACATARLTAADERDGELRCTKCGDWKPDNEYRAEQRKTRRGRRSHCRACETKARQDHRLRNLETSRAYDRNHKRKGRPMSIYVVLRKDGDGRWAELDRVQAASRNHAVEVVAAGEGVYAAMTEGQLTELPVAETVAFKVVRDGGDPA